MELGTSVDFSVLGAGLSVDGGLGGEFPTNNGSSTEIDGLFGWLDSMNKGKGSSEEFSPGIEVGLAVDASSDDDDCSVEAGVDTLPGLTVSSE